jgi:hypothetical protein
MTMSEQATRSGGIDELLPGFEPENELERRVSADARLLENLRWGKPRKGHPEGSIAAHVSDLLERLDGWDEPPARRADLRFIVLVHDSFKAEVIEKLPRVGPNHHADRARRFAESYTSDRAVLTTIQHHDRPYALWRKMRRRRSLDERGFTSMVDDLADIALFVRFVELDGSTDGKTPDPIRWLRAELERRGHGLPHPPRV